MKKKISEILSESTGYEDFAYVLQDSGNYYFGARYTYGDMMENESVPFKFKAVIEHYIMKDTEPDTTLESQLYYMTEDQFSYRTLVQLKAKVKVSVLVPRKKLFSRREEYVYEEQVLNLKDLVQMNLAKKKGSGIMIRELIVSKLALMGFSV